MTGAAGTSTRCPFCAMAAMLDAGPTIQVVYADASLFVVPDGESLGMGHCLVVPGRHAREVHDLPEAEYLQVFTLARRLAPALRAATGARAIAYTAFGSGLPHAHLHLVPHDDQRVLLEPVRFVRRLADDELASQASYLRSFVAGR